MYTCILSWHCIYKHLNKINDYSEVITVKFFLAYKSLHYNFIKLANWYTSSLLITNPNMLTQYPGHRQFITKSIENGSFANTRISPQCQLNQVVTILIHLLYYYISCLVSCKSWNYKLKTKSYKWTIIMNIKNYFKSVLITYVYYSLGKICVKKVIWDNTYEAF